MTRRQKATITAFVAGAVAVMGTIGWFGYRIHFTLSHLHEAYAAWDTGELLVGYMQANKGRWPTSWPDLLSVLDPKSEQPVVIRGAGAGDMAAYIRSLKEVVAIDWHFDPAHPSTKQPVTRLDGTGFPVRYEGPNDMVRNYLRQHAATRRSEFQSAFR